jgi:hypothetical protein
MELKSGGPVKRLWYKYLHMECLSGCGFPSVYTGLDLIACSMSLDEVY